MELTDPVGQLFVAAGIAIGIFRRTLTA